MTTKPSTLEIDLAREGLERVARLAPRADLRALLEDVLAERAGVVVDDLAAWLQARLEPLPAEARRLLVEQVLTRCAAGDRERPMAPREMV